MGRSGLVTHALVLLAIARPSVALAEGDAADPPAADQPKDDKPKGRIINPWGRIPRPRDGMRLPDPRTAAEKATPRPTSGSVPAGTPTVPESQVTVEPASAGVPAPAPDRTEPARAPSIRTTKTPVVHPPSADLQEGLTLEAGTGIGWIHLADDYASVTSPGGVAGLSIGIGGWIDRSFALTVRLAGSSVPSDQGLVIAAFLGPSMQLWISERTWIGAGFGLAGFGIDAEGSDNDRSFGGYAVDVRLGHTFYTRGNHTLNASLEATPGRVSYDSGYSTMSLTVTSIGLLLGWQYL